MASELSIPILNVKKTKGWKDHMIYRHLMAALELSWI